MQRRKKGSGLKFHQKLAWALAGGSRGNFVLKVGV